MSKSNKIRIRNLKNDLRHIKRLSLVISRVLPSNLSYMVELKNE